MVEHRLGELLAPFLLGELIADERRELECHLEGCAGCRRELDLLRQTHHLLRGLAANEPPPDLKAKTLERRGVEPTLLRRRTEAPINAAGARTMGREGRSHRTSA